MRGTVDETLDALQDAEADRLCSTQRYEHARRDTRAGHYERTLEAEASEVTLKVPKLRHPTFETAIVGRYRRREASVGEAFIEMNLAGVPSKSAAGDPVERDTDGSVRLWPSWR